jgi:hypothetical protein
MANPLKKVVSRVKTAAREVRDIPTAIGTSMSAQQDYRQGNPADRRKMNQNINRADKNYQKQVIEAARAILKGEPGTSSDVMKGYTEYEKGKSREGRLMGPVRKINRNR